MSGNSTPPSSSTTGGGGGVSKEEEEWFSMSSQAQPISSQTTATAATATTAAHHSKKKRQRNPHHPSLQPSSSTTTTTTARLSSSSKPTSMSHHHHHHQQQHNHANGGNHNTHHYSSYHPSSSGNSVPKYGPIGFAFSLLVVLVLINLRGPNTNTMTLSSNGNNNNANFGGGLKASYVQQQQQQPQLQQQQQGFGGVGVGGSGQYGNQYQLNNNAYSPNAAAAAAVATAARGGVPSNTAQYNPSTVGAAAAAATGVSSNPYSSNAASSNPNYNNNNAAPSSTSTSTTTSTNSYFKTGDFTESQKTWKTDRTVSVKTVAETPFARCDVHSVRSEDGQSIIEDWIFLEERNAINVLVQLPDGKYLIMKQGKYAIDGQTLSPVGGFISAGEAPFDAARREVIEETGMSSEKTRETLKTTIGGFNTPVTYTKDGMPDGQTTKDETDWLFLGKYRTAANRGGGFTYCYLLKNAIDIVPKGGTQKFEGRGDDEDQIFLKLDPIQMAEALANGDFKEIKWTAVVAMSLLQHHGALPPMGTTQIRDEK